MGLNTEGVKQTVNQLLNSIEDKFNNGMKVVELREEHTAIYKNITTESLVSNDKDEIFDYLSWLLYAGGLQNYNFAKTHDALNKIIPIVNKLAVMVQGQPALPALVAEIQKLQLIIEKTNEGRSRGGKTKEKAKQESMQKIEQTYIEKCAEGYSFKEGLLSKFYEDMAKIHNLDCGSVKNRIEKLRKQLNHTSRPKKQSS